MNEEQKNSLASVLAAFKPGNTVHVNQMDPQDDLAKKGRRAGDTFTDMVSGIIGMPNERLALLGQDIWGIFHHGIVRLAMGGDVKCLSIAIVPPKMLHMLGETGTKHKAAVFSPNNWIELVEKDPLMQFGAVLCVGSQAVDFYNERHLQDPLNIQKRALTYEAMYLNQLPEKLLNDYQKGVVERYSEVDPTLFYDRKKVEVLH